MQKKFITDAPYVPTCSWCHKTIPTIFNHGCFYYFNKIDGNNFETNDDGTLKIVFNNNTLMSHQLVCKSCFSKFEQLLDELGKEKEADKDDI